MLGEDPSVARPGGEGLIPGDAAGGVHPEGVVGDGGAADVVPQEGHAIGGEVARQWAGLSMGERPKAGGGRYSDVQRFVVADGSVLIEDPPEVGGDRLGGDAGRAG